MTGVAATIISVKMRSVRSRSEEIFCDSTDGTNASVIGFTMIEVTKAYDLNVYNYLIFLLEKRLNARTSKKELEKLAPWNKGVQKRFFIVILRNVDSL